MCGAYPNCVMADAVSRERRVELVRLFTVHGGEDICSGEKDGRIGCWSRATYLGDFEVVGFW